MILNSSSKFLLGNKNFAAPAANRLSSLYFKQLILNFPVILVCNSYKISSDFQKIIATMPLKDIFFYCPPKFIKKNSFKGLNNKFFLKNTLYGSTIFIFLKNLIDLQVFLSTKIEKLSVFSILLNGHSVLLNPALVVSKLNCTTFEKLVFQRLYNLIYFFVGFIKSILKKQISNLIYFKCQPPLN